jgi:hypothetical protein
MLFALSTLVVASSAFTGPRCDVVLAPGRFADRQDRAPVLIEGALA